jgi:hypothetical protein
MNPPAATGEKVITADSDHIELFQNRDLGADPSMLSIWVWKSFLRGHNTICVGTIEPAFGGQDKEGAEDARRTMGATKSYADRMDLASMTPQNSLSSTSYCLANSGKEYLVYQPSSGSFTVNLQAGTYNYEWFKPTTYTVAGTGTFTASSGNKRFTPPFAGTAILYLHL